jgi:hypothetical protein
MTRLNKGTRLLTAPLQTEKVPTGKTHEGAAGYARDSRTELFMRATTVFAGEGSFYEDAKTADDRAIELTRQLAKDDFTWLRGFLPWLRSDAYIRTSAVMLAAETAWSLNGTPDSTAKVADLVDKVLQRGDEVTEIIQYCLNTFGKIPKAVREGTAKAMLRLWRERAVIRYDKPDRPLRFADAIELVHPDVRKVRAPKDLTLTHDRYKGWENSWEAAAHYEAGHKEHLTRLFKYLLDERHHGDGNPEGLRMISARTDMGQMTPKGRHAYAAAALADRESDASRQLKLATAGQWEFVKSWLGEGAADLPTALSERERWELVLPWMGYMAVLRNLRNFEQAGIKPEMVREIQRRLSDPGEVADSRQLPFRFLTAHLNTKSSKWLDTLETALGFSVGNVPHMPGRGLIMIDMSGSMRHELSQRPSRRKDGKEDDAVRPNRIQAAALFALCLAQANAGRVDVFGFADPPGGHRWGTPNPGHIKFEGVDDPSFSVLRMMGNVVGKIGVVGLGTAIEQNLRQCYDGHDWVAIFSDEQTIPGGPAWNPHYAHEIGDITACIPQHVDVFAWNLAGYSNGAFPTGGNRYALAGLTDASFGIMQRIMSGKSAVWPWEK